MEELFFIWPLLNDFVLWVSDLFTQISYIPNTLTLSLFEGDVTKYLILTFCCSIAPKKKHSVPIEVKIISIDNILENSITKTPSKIISLIYAFLLYLIAL